MKIKMFTVLCTILVKTYVILALYAILLKLTLQIVHSQISFHLSRQSDVCFFLNSNILIISQLIWNLIIHIAEMIENFRIIGWNIL
jgi:hypothetical protein